jgi:hypothetical protein
VIARTIRMSLIALALSACGPPTDLAAEYALHVGLDKSCVTRSGMLVEGIDLCGPVEAVQLRAETLGATLGFTRSLVGATMRLKLDVTPHGTWEETEGEIIGGLTNCSARVMTVAFGSEEEVWETTAFAHEAMHLMQGCPWDEREEDPSHPQWETVYPALLKDSTTHQTKIYEPEPV